MKEKYLVGKSSVDIISIQFNTVCPGLDYIAIIN